MKLRESTNYESNLYIKKLTPNEDEDSKGMYDL